MSDDSENKIHRVDTTPPPAGGNAYEEATVVRQAPQEVLDAIKKARELNKLNAAAPSDSHIPVPTITPFRPGAMIDDDPPDENDATVIGETAKMPTKTPSSDEPPMSISQRAKAISHAPIKSASVPPESRRPRSDAPRAAAIVPAPVTPSFAVTLVAALLLIAVVALLIQSFSS
jgi:hypothetical protein